MIGQKLNNRYTIIDQIGKGAMGTVYRAKDSQTGQDVALKIISSELALDPAMLERFKREGNSLRELKHINIVGFMDSFQHDEHYVIVMEYVAGGSLFELIKAGALPVERARQITLDLCDALIRSHRLNIIHRDIKPENVMIAEDGTPKLADFGVARLSEGTRITRTGAQVGTPYYMAPEAWAGKSDAQSDIWSLGVVLFEMLTGDVPFDGDTPLVVMNKINTAQPPDLKKLRAEVSGDLVKIVSRMLTRDKKKRYQTMRELAVDLERAQQTTAKPKPVISKGVLRLGLWLTGLIVLIFAGASLIGKTNSPTAAESLKGIAPIITSKTETATLTLTPEPSPTKTATLTLTPEPSPTKTATITVNNLIAPVKFNNTKLREGPDLRFPAVGDLIIGTECELVARYKAWFQVVCFFEKKGWLVSEWLDISPDVDLSALSELTINALLQLSPNCKKYGC